MLKKEAEGVDRSMNKIQDCLPELFQPYTVSMPFGECSGRLFFVMK